MGDDMKKEAAQTADKQAEKVKKAKNESAEAAEKPKQNEQSGSDGTETIKAEEKAADVKTEAAVDPLTQAQSDAKNFQDLYLRKAADFENYRRRMIREKAEAGDYAVSKLISEMLPILDNFDRAIAAKVDGNAESMKAFVDGVIMIKGQLEGMLSRNYGLEYYVSKGEVFDPHIHEAVAKQASSDVTVETVGEEIQKGYKLKDKVLRHAKVLVLMPQESGQQETTESTEA